MRSTAMAAQLGVIKRSQGFLLGCRGTCIYAAEIGEDAAYTRHMVLRC